MKKFVIFFVIVIFAIGSIMVMINREYPGSIRQFYEDNFKKEPVKPPKPKMVCEYFGKISGDSTFFIQSDSLAKIKGLEEYQKSFTCKIGVPPRNIAKLEVLNTFFVCGRIRIIAVADTMGEYNENFGRRTSFFLFPPPTNCGHLWDLGKFNSFRGKPIELLDCPY